MNISRRPRALALLSVFAAALLALTGAAVAQNTNANVKGTKHNLSASGSGSVKSAAVGSGGTDQICVFCHTPHAANAAAPAPLWNRALNTGTYTPYTSNSLDAENILGGSLGQPGGASKLCLSCHDGTLALGTVANAPGSGGKDGTISMTGTNAGKMPDGLGATTGYTRNLGTDLRNDHPISFTFQNTGTIEAPATDLLSQADGELRSPPYSTGGKLVVGKRSSGVKPMLPLDHEGKVQCTSCHDPHIEASKFLRLNRLQKVAPTGGEFSASNDQICLGCHNKLGTSWSQSAHADQNVADESYQALAASRRDFYSTGTTPAKVWEAACLNCHDTHTVQGSRRLLREGVETSSTGTDAGAYKAGSSNAPATVSAVEETCYQCHQGTATKAIASGNGSVPDIKTEFERPRRMPIKTADQGGNAAGSEKHDIHNADFEEDATLLGAGNHANRHVECTDCHNPHRVIRNSKFYGTPGDGNSAKRTHDAGGIDGNIASGVLRGTWGVEPSYGSFGTPWPELPSYTIKKGDPGSSASTLRNSTYLTREYQLCFKCHSDWGGSSGGKMPRIGNYTGGTAASTNSFDVRNGAADTDARYTNIAAEFGVSATDYGGSLASLTGTHQCEAENDTSCTPVGATWDTFTTNASTVNHRSWHPVHYPTGRTAAERSNNGSGGDTNFKAPFKASLGIQTMYCSDCHGNAASWTDGSGPNTAQVQGPHGAQNDFLLKGVWNPLDRNGNISAGGTGATAATEGLCGNCHVGSVSRTDSGFGAADTSGHSSSEHGKRCGYCHIAVPHGWKNKAFLVNLNCVGPEGGASGNCVSNRVGNQAALTYGPYYIGSVLRVRTWQASRRWTETSCGSPSASGENWMDGTC